MTYRWEPTTPLDRILATGFKRIDEAVEGVIAKHGEPYITVHIDQPDLEDFWHNAQKRYNYQMSKMIEEAPIAELARRQSVGLLGGLSHDYTVMGMAAQQGAMGFNDIGNKLS